MNNEVFILRTVPNQGNSYEHNKIISDYYEIVHSKNKEDFARLASESGYTDPVERNIFAFLITVIEEGENVILPLTWDNSYYIMTSSGKTFARISGQL